MTPLHDVEALVALAEAEPGPAQAWAATRLAIVAPERFRWMPSTDDIHDVMVMAGPPTLIPVLTAALRKQPWHGWCATLGLAVEYGLVTDPAALADAVRPAMSGQGAPGDLWLVGALAALGLAEPADLAVAARVTSDAREDLLPAIVLRVAERVGALEEAAREVAASLVSADARRVAMVLGILGAPTLPSAADLGSAAALGAARAGVAPPPLKLRKGSVARQIGGAVLDLLDGVAGPLPALLRALARASGPLSADDVVLASWLRSFTPGDPVDDVLSRGDQRDARRLSAARVGLTPAHAPALRAAMARPLDGVHAAVVGMGLLRQDPTLARAAVDHLYRDHDDDVAAMVAAAAAWHCADDVAGFLAERETRDWGLYLAEWVPTEEVLRALLELPVPADLAPRQMYAAALAAMGDPAAVPRLQALAAGDASGTFDDAVQLAAALVPG